MKGIAGNVALVIGATAGIGREVAMCFADHGAKLMLCARREAEGRALAAELQGRGVDAQFRAADVQRAPEVEAVVAAAIDHFGQLDFMVNSAGVQGPFAPTADQEEADFDRIVAINLKGTWLAMKYALRAMQTQARGSIVNIVSAAGLTAFPTHVAPYVASKHGAIGLTRTAAIEYARQGIRVNAICPGAVRTEMSSTLLADPAVHERISAMHAMGRIAEVSEVAPAAVWLCSEESTFISGHSLVIDGAALAGKF